ncbi:MAG: ATP-dependent sacrificial sulfur transferase LarE [Candidatus Methanomethylicia archaeon]
MSASEKWVMLTSWFKQFKSVIIAFSGGVDSSLLTLAAKEALSSNAIAVTAKSPILPSRELNEATKIASIINIRHIVIETDELKDFNFTRNPPNRCYYCKKSLIRKLKDLASKLNIETIVTGTNADELREYRPGHIAEIEEGVKTPYVELGFTKMDIRNIAKNVGLPNWDKPSMACLASRIPYESEITEERLRRIDEAERMVKDIVDVKQIRVRDHDGIARIEVNPEERSKFFNIDVMNRINESLKSIGFIYVTLDLSGYNPGSMNKTLKHKININHTEFYKS